MSSALTGFSNAATDPDSFDFTDNSNVAQSNLELSVTTGALAGFDIEITATVTGHDAQIRKNATGSWGSSVDVVAGDVINIRMTSAGTPSTTRTATVTVGSAVADWDVTTAP